LESFFLPLSSSWWGHRQEKELLLCRGDGDREEEVEQEEEEGVEEGGGEGVVDGGGEGEEPVEEFELKAPSGTLPLMFLLKEVPFSCF
jgi:hypothetical protein